MEAIWPMISQPPKELRLPLHRKCLVLRKRPFVWLTVRDAIISNRSDQSDRTATATSPHESGPLCSFFFLFSHMLYRTRRSLEISRLQPFIVPDFFRNYSYSGINLFIFIINMVRFTAMCSKSIRQWPQQK